MGVKKLKLAPEILKDNGLFIIDLDKVKNIPFEIKEKSVVYIPPKEIGGNHQHPRQEAFIGLGKGLKIAWLDRHGSKKETKMHPKGKLFLFLISPHTPHVVINNSETEPGTLVEFASQKQHRVKQAEVIKV